ncbi:MAG: hypothetical protein A2898_02025 [Candidatus Kerfeldbacteria bacterium RIFCSPLOWO2_01_FULL_48_11]|uniref:Uncharacterized protein n=1 Tax=Candidatus Kerfeldbacteria bacterium RIFCSPLOWO2_01_FULL_48_11 TaxID=1798543 RepID=A0A1G2B4V9_9BACT|nr:MAG: hypothetical protein A2898_02025 [Candidatus Kerfeldbacteria bacterium RIFCSPLOWO2_01_FULL_48_11]
MKKVELEQVIAQINEKIGDANTLKQTIDNATATGKQVDELLKQLNTQKATIEDFVQKFTEINQSVGQSKVAVDEAAASAKEYQAKISEQEKQYTTLKEEVDQLKVRTDDLLSTADEQLGRVSSQVLANSFSSEVKKLEESVDNWFKWLLYSTGALLIVAISIVIYQIEREGTLIALNFLVKVVLTSPLVYLVTFVSSQYSREKKLLEEYRFKSTIALSFEAYRKLIREEITDMGITEEKKQERALDFIVNSVGNIYSSPMKNISDHGAKSDKEGDLPLSQIDKIVDIIRKVVIK